MSLDWLIDRNDKAEVAAWRHVAPFLAWVVLIPLLDDGLLGGLFPRNPNAWGYAIRTAVGGALLLWLRPWRYYEKPRWRHVPVGVAAGLLVFALWVGFESAWMKAHAPGLAEFYERWFVGFDFGKLREPLAGSDFDPAKTGWGLFAVHLLGTAVVIAVAEEFFWRGFLYRWLLGRNFLEVSLGQFNRSMFLVVAAFFAIEHVEWLAGFLCGLIYGGLVVWTRSLWPAVIAHVVTNGVLGWYVVRAGAWQFW